MRFRNTKLIFAVLAVLLIHTAMAHACPGCKQALANADGEQSNMVNGYFWSILFMLAMPFTLLGVFAGSMYLAVRRARKEASQNGFVANGDMNQMMRELASNV